LAPDKGRVTDLALSPDGRNLAMMLITRSGEKRLQQVAVVGVDGNDFHAVTEPAESGTMVPVLSLAWSPDNRWIYSVRVKKPQSELWRIPAGGGAAEYAQVSAAGLKYIDLSADGSRLAFTAGQRTEQELWVLENLLPVQQAAR
jgi:hypothetical protein